MGANYRHGALEHKARECRDAGRHGDDRRWKDHPAAIECLWSAQEFAGGKDRCERRTGDNPDIIAHPRGDPEDEIARAVKKGGSGDRGYVALKTSQVACDEDRQGKGDPEDRPAEWCPGSSVGDGIDRAQNPVLIDVEIPRIRNRLRPGGEVRSARDNEPGGQIEMRETMLRISDRVREDRPQPEHPDIHVALIIERLKAVEAERAWT